MQLDLRKRLETGTENCEDTPVCISASLCSSDSFSLHCLAFYDPRPHKKNSIYRAPELTCDNSGCMKNYLTSLNPNSKFLGGEI